jgi:hypothetical protein
MKFIKEIFITYFALWGFFVLLAPLFMIVIGLGAYLTRFIVSYLGFSDAVADGGMLVASFILIWLLSKLYGVLKMLRMERQIKDK